ncbi:tetratricopeptide repeat protein, partial [Verrucomicrobia bacterium]|nr:tetratricopeptide repeat protein [Verrucomicrobiota bacterium]
WIRWGQMLDLSGESAEAIKKYESVFEIVPNSLSANKALSAHYFKAKEYKKSEKYFRATVKITPQDAESNLGLALSLIKQRKADEGVSVLRYVLEIDPNNSPAKRYLKQLGLSN